MTVHGAKGLEAPIVVLADSTTPPHGWHPPRLLHLPAARAVPDAAGPVVWASSKANDTDAMAAARQISLDEAGDEYRRLLYVAMTRAAEQLVVCGTQGKNKIPDGSWYQLIEDALKQDSLSEAAEFGGGDVLRYRKGDAPPPVLRKNNVPAAIKPTSLPAWLSTNAAADTPAPPTVTPSSDEDDDDARPFAPAGNAQALLRGTLVHRLMQSLPDIAPQRRLKAAQDYLARAGIELASEERQKIAEQVMLVLEDSRFYELYGAHSRAEVPIVGLVQLAGKTVRVSGQIDRLAVTQTTVLIADFKTNRPTPRRIEEVPASYMRQLALYRAVLTKLYPEKSVQAALVWTEVPVIMEISGAVMDAALAGITPA
jgi:ATP-dependent helicase/nuclease subunit A